MFDIAEVTQHKAFQLKGSLFTLTVLQLIEPEPEAFKSQLADLLIQAPKFFADAPVVLDLQTLINNNTPVDFNALIKELRAVGMIPIGVRGGTQDRHQAARKAGLAILSAAKTETPQITTRQKKPSTEIKTEKARSRIITKPVRSGQQIYAKDGDLIILGPVSEGAELLADGSIHIYGPLRGRALAGIQGDSEARIFCHSLEAELVSIAGSYIVSEAMLESHQRQPTQIYLKDGGLKIVPL